MKKNKGNIMRFKSADEVKKYCNDLLKLIASHSLFILRLNIYRDAVVVKLNLLL